MSLSIQVEDKAWEKSGVCNEPMALDFGNKFPSEGLTDLFRRLQQHSKERGFRFLNAHFGESTLVLQEEISKLPPHIRSQVPHFDNIATLSENGYLRYLGLGPAIESALLIVLQLGLFIRHHEALERKLNRPEKVTTVAGKSMGLFPGAAVAQSTTLAEVVKNGAEALRASFCLGVYVGNLTQKLEAQRPDGFQSILAHGVTGMTEESVRGELNRIKEELEKPERSTSGPSRALFAMEGRTVPPHSLRWLSYPSAPTFLPFDRPEVGDESPIGCSERLGTETGNRPLIRHDIEAMRPPKGNAADACHEFALHDMVCPSGKIKPGVELPLAWRFAIHIRPSRVDELTSQAAGSLLLIGLHCAPDASDVEGIAARVTKSPPSQVQEQLLTHAFS
ncbi:Non-reducing polyketide synthase vrtA [Penicillium canariense]|uniref:Non-reducing polyketide synthase vrtA n=1 Tax=Penicillium canariense TaxID=189055 RepID=A0A9W9LF57_9EURO|nr:Non-reducing polyketide synthase vrtA [Penicillium canariense]KAJ5153201.1 Non-reducing polyketide synthase vrtA [Penicillium canariense]